MSSQIQFRTGNPHTFIACRSFKLGTSGLDVSEGSELTYDGTYVSYGGSPPVAIQLRGAIKLGWLVLEGDYDSEDISGRMPMAAGVQVRQAIGGNPDHPRSKVATTTVEAEEQEVGSVAQHSANTKTRNASNYRRETMTVEKASSEGVIVSRRIQTPAKQTTNLEKESPQAAISRANSVKIQAGQGISQEEMLARMEPEAQEEYLAQIQSHRSTHVDENEPKIVGKVKTAKKVQKEGFNVTNQVGGGVGIADMGGTGGVAQVSTAESEGMRFTNTNGPGSTIRAPQRKTVSKASELASAVGGDLTRQIARAMCPDFPDTYDFTASPKKKIARIQADFEDRPDVIRAVAAADTDPEVRQRLVAEFPEAFGL